MTAPGLYLEITYLAHIPREKSNEGKGSGVTKRQSANAEVQHIP